MSLSETARASARQRNERRISGLTERLDALKAQEVTNSRDLAEAFRPLVEMMADLMRDADLARSQTTDLLDRLESSLNRLELAMGGMPDRMEASARSAGEGVAQRVEAIAEALERLGRTAGADLRAATEEARKVTLRQTEEQAEAARTSEARMGAALKRMEAAAVAQTRAAREVQKAQTRTAWLLVAGVVVALLAIGAAMLSSASWRGARAAQTPAYLAPSQR